MVDSVCQHCHENLGPFQLSLAIPGSGFLLGLVGRWLLRVQAPHLEPQCREKEEKAIGEEGGCQKV